MIRAHNALRTLKAVLVSGIALTAPPAFAQDPPSPVGMVDLNDALSSATEGQVLKTFGYEALMTPVEGLAPGEDGDLIAVLTEVARRHPIVRTALARSLEASDAVREARAGQYPQVSVGVNTSIQSRNRTSENLLTPERNLRIAEVGADVTQVIYDFGATFSRIDAARNKSEAAQEAARSSVDNFAVGAAAAYLDVIRYRYQVDLAEANVIRHENIRSYVKERSDAGAGSKADFLRVEGRLSDARSQVIGGRANFEQAVAKYRELFREEPGPLALPRVAPSMPVSVEAAVEEALDRNPDYRRQKALTEAAREEYFAARADRWPRIAAQVSGTGYRILGKGGANQPDLFDVTGRLVVNYKLFSGGAEQARARQAQHRLDQARYDEDNMVLELERAIRFAYTDVSMRSERLRSLDLAVESNLATIGAYSQLFTVGRRNLTDLLDAHRDHEGSLVALIDNRIELEIARYKLLALTGALGPALGVERMEKEAGAR